MATPSRTWIASSEPQTNGNGCKLETPVGGGRHQFFFWPTANRRVPFCCVFYGGRVSWSPFKRYSAHLRGPLKPPFGSEKTNTKSTFYSKRNISAITSAKDTNSAILAAILTLRDPQAPTTFNTYTCPSSRTQDFESTPNDPKLVLPPPPIDPHPSIPVASCHLVSKRPIRVRV